MSKPKQDMPINPFPSPPIIYCLHCPAALVNGKCPNGHGPAPKGEDGRN